MVCAGCPIASVSQRALLPLERRPLSCGVPRQRLRATDARVSRIPPAQPEVPLLRESGWGEGTRRRHTCTRSPPGVARSLIRPCGAPSPAGRRDSLRASLLPLRTPFPREGAMSRRQKCRSDACARVYARTIAVQPHSVADALRDRRRARGSLSDSLAGNASSSAGNAGIGVRSSMASRLSHSMNSAAAGLGSRWLGCTM